MRENNRKTTPGRPLQKIVEGEFVKRRDKSGKLRKVKNPNAGRIKFIKHKPANYGL